ncbi:uncharacterized protein LOC128391819 [Panonychus citri]|uniref:uncharacterized protein LOC128391819 n=1 Tax=Panonychus citri TaxID=50023 RepID=UPI0023077BB2|nr:uncharacterized protein LOC128391819 [Panonychus citri]
MGQGMNGNSQQNKFNSGQGSNGQTSSTGGTSMMTQNGQSTRGNRQMAPINNGKGNYPQGNQMNGQTNGQNFGPVNNNGINSPPQQGINQNSNMRPLTGIPGQNNNMQVTKSPTNSGQQLYRLQNRRIG